MDDVSKMSKPNSADTSESVQIEVMPAAPAASASLAETLNLSDLPVSITESEIPPVDENVAMLKRKIFNGKDLNSLIISI